MVQTKRVFSSWCAAAIVFSGAAGAAAQTSALPPPAVEAERDWTYGGFIDAAYLDAFNDPPNKLFRSRGTAWHVDDWYLNMAGAYWRKRASERSRWGAEALLHSGKDDEIFGFSATAPNLGGADWLRHLGPTNVSYLAAIGNGLTVQGGIFSSFIGYDSLYAKDNLNYTRPWSADFTPYLMLGVNASYPFTEKLTGALFVTNGYWHLANANRVPSPGAQLAYKATPQITVKQTILTGPHQSNTSPAFWRHLSNTIVERRTERLVAAVDFHVATERVDTAEPVRAWWVAAQAPIRWNLRGPWGVAVRPEMAWDSDGRWTLASQTVKAVTTTLEYRLARKWSTATLRLEHRVDDSRGPQGGFFDDHESSPGVFALRPRQHLLIFAVVLTADASYRR